MQLNAEVHFLTKDIFADFKTITKALSNNLFAETRSPFLINKPKNVL
jgi:hypothetical protein